MLSKAAWNTFNFVISKYTEQTSQGDHKGKLRKADACNRIGNGSPYFGMRDFFGLWGAAGSYPERMKAIAVSPDNAGTRYALYDETAGAYILAYLDDDRRAETPEDVCAVLYISEGAEQITKYGENGYVYKRYKEIRLVDQKTGKTVLTDRVFGKMPSDLWKSTAQGTREVYGAHPEKEAVEKAVDDMIDRYEKILKSSGM